MSKGKKYQKLTEPQKPTPSSGVELRLTNPEISERPVLGMTLILLAKLSSRKSG